MAADTQLGVHFKERTLEWWQQEIKLGLEFRNQVANADREWPLYRQMYRHKEFGFRSGHKVIPVNFIFAFGRALIPQVAPRRQHITIVADRPGFEAHAKVLERLDNKLIETLMLKDELRTMVLDNFLSGIAIGFDGYDSAYGFKPSLTESAIEHSGTFSQFDKKSGNRIEYNRQVAPGMPWFFRADPEDVVFPWGTYRARESQWVALRVMRPVDDIKKDPKYKNASDLKGMHVRRKTMGMDATPRDPVATPVSFAEQEEIAELWQVRDFKTGSILVFTLDHDKFLRNEPDTLQADSSLVHTVSFNEDVEFVYGIPDARLILPQQREATEARTQASFHRRVAILKFLIKAGAMKPSDIDKLLDEDVKAAVFVNSEAGPLRDTVITMGAEGTAAILQEMQFSINAAREDVREVIGMGRNQLGEFDAKTHRTKFEAAVVQGVSSIRIDERRDMLGDMTINIVKNFNRYMFRHWTAKRLQQILGPDGGRYWVEFTGKELESEYIYSLSAADAVPVSQATEKQNALELLEGWTKYQPGVPVPKELLRYALSQYPNINVEAVLAATPDAMQAGNQSASGGAPIGLNQAQALFAQQGGGGIR